MDAAVPVFGTREPGVDYRPRPAAYAVVFDEAGRIACVTEESGLYLPGGGIDAGEDALAALHREVAEECALALEVLAPLGRAIQYYRSARGETFELRASFFLARFGDSLPGEPAHVLHWLPSRSAPPFFHECHRWALERALAREARPPREG